MSFLDELRWRGLLHQCTSEAALTAHMDTPGRLAYSGFDPTADSLTIGNLVPILLLVHWQRAGHVPIVVMGGGTGLIGDPSGKDDERPLMDHAEVEANIERQRPIFERLLRFGGTCAATIVNNADWLEGLGYLEALRDLGKHFSVNAMIRSESVAARLEDREQGISYTEFSYAILQACDFLHLRREMQCTVQVGGSDQYGNIVAGIDLIRRAMQEAPDDEPRGFGITAPLVTGAGGRKIGKTERGAVWLSADRTSPYAFHQFWRNVEDVEVEPYLKWFTLLEPAEIAAIVDRHSETPQARHGQRALADHVTAMIHGDDEARRAQQAAEALFGGDVASLDAELLAEVIADVPGSEHGKAHLGGERASLVEILPQTTLCASRREAREFLGNGSITINGARLDGGEALERVLRSDDLLHGTTILLRRGRKAWHATTWS